MSGYMRRLVERSTTAANVGGVRAAPRRDSPTRATTVDDPFQAAPIDGAAAPVVAPRDDRAEAESRPRRDEPTAPAETRRVIEVRHEAIVITRAPSPAASSTSAPPASVSPAAAAEPRDDRAAPGRTSIDTKDRDREVGNVAPRLEPARLAPILAPRPNDDTRPIPRASASRAGDVAPSPGTPPQATRAILTTLAPRVSAPPAAPLRTEPTPTITIGRVVVEVVPPARPAPSPPVAQPRRATPSSSNAPNAAPPEAHRTNLRFGLGQM